MPRTYLLILPPGLEQLKAAKNQLPENLWQMQHLSTKTEIANGTLTNLFSDHPERCDPKTLFSAQDKINQLLTANEISPDFHIKFELGKDYRELPSDPTLPPLPQHERDGGADAETRIISLLTACRHEGIVGIYWQDALRERLIEAVMQAERFVFTLARTHRNMLIEDGEEDGWLMSTLEDKITNSPQMLIRVLLGDGFSPDAGYRRELAKYFKDATARSHYQAARNTVRGTIQRIQQIADNAEQSHNFRLRLLDLAPPHCLMVTDRVCFYETYLPSRTGGSSFTIEVRKLPPSTPPRKVKKGDHLPPYTTFLQDFVQQYNKAQHTSAVIEAFRNRKYADNNLSDEAKGRKTKIEDVLKILNKWGRDADLDENQL